MPFTTLKKLSVQAAGTNSGVWGAGGTTGSDLNTGVMGPLDTIVAGISTFSVSSSNVSLTFTAGGGGDVNNCAWRFTGTLLANIVVSPAAGDATTYLNGFYYFENLTTGSFTITLTTAAGSVALPQSRRGVLFIDGTNGPRLMSVTGVTGPDDFPVGTSCLFLNTDVPTGWTKGSTYNNHALRLSTTTGGNATGSVDFTTLFGRTGTDPVTLSAANIPSSGLTYQRASLNIGTTVNPAGATGVGTSLTETATALSGASGAAFTPAIDMRLRYLTALIGTRV